MSYSEDLRKKVIDYIHSGHTQKSAQNVFKIGSTTIKRWLKQFKETGSLKNKPLNRSHKKINPDTLFEYVTKHPDAYLREIAEHFNCSGEGIRKALKRLKITLKKKRLFTGNVAKKSVKII
jgi:transposase